MGSPPNVQRLPTSDVSIAEGLEALARDVRSGKTGARRCLVVIERPGVDGGDVGSVFFGAPAAGMHLVGLLEYAKANVIAEGT